MLARLLLLLILPLSLSAEPAKDCVSGLHPWSLKLSVTPDEPKLLAEFKSGAVLKIYAQTFSTRLLFEGAEQGHQSAKGIKFYIVTPSDAFRTLRSEVVLEQHSSRHFRAKDLQVYRARRTFLKRALHAAKLAAHDAENERVLEVECVGDGSKDYFDFEYGYGQNFKYDQILDGSVSELEVLDLARHLITQIPANYDIQGHSHL